MLSYFRRGVVLGGWGRGVGDWVDVSERGRLFLNPCLKKKTCSQNDSCQKKGKDKKCRFFTQKENTAPQKAEVLHEKLKTVLPMWILKKKFSIPNYTKFLNP